jgi:hypothetical protein
MRTIVHPPRTAHCEICHGELRLKRTYPDGPFSESDTAILVCAKCSHKQLYRVSRDPYATQTASYKPPTKVT